MTPRCAPAITELIDDSGVVALSTSSFQPGLGTQPLTAGKGVNQLDVCLKDLHVGSPPTSRGLITTENHCTGTT